jgi:hypothetical protein
MEGNQLPEQCDIVHEKRKRKKEAMTTPIQRPRAATAEVTRVVAVTSGKGGVGKTNIVANMGYLFTPHEKEDARLRCRPGLGNLDILLGFAPRYNFSHVITGEKDGGRNRRARPRRHEDPAGLVRYPGTDRAFQRPDHPGPFRPRAVSSTRWTFFIIDTGAPAYRATS